MIKHWYKLLKITDGEEKVIEESENWFDLEQKAEQLNHFNADFTFSYYEVEKVF